MKFRFSSRNNLILEVNNRSICRIRKICDKILINIYGDSKKLSFNAAIQRVSLHGKIYKLFDKYGMSDPTELIKKLPNRSQQQNFIDDLYALIIEEKLTK